MKREHPTSIAYIALGSNLGDRAAIIRSAIDALAKTPRIEFKAVSDIIETEPIGPPDQGRYLNAAAELRTTFTPRELLTVCLSIEAAHGRERSSQQRWAARLLDIDLLLYDDQVIDEPGLHVPHPRLAERRFVLAPLAQIAPLARHPVLGQTVQALLSQLGENQSGEYHASAPCSPC